MKKPNLLEEYAELAAMWAYDLNGELTPDKVTSGSSKKVYWRCQDNEKHVFKRPINKMISYRTKEVTGCIYCSKNAKIPFPGENDFLTVVPEARVMWDWENNTLEPTQLLPYSNKRANFKCEYGHQFSKKITDFTKSPYCPECLKEQSSYVQNVPVVKEFWDTKKNTDDLNGLILSAKTMEWYKCPDCGYEWEATLALFREKPFCPCCGFDTKSHREVEEKIITLRMDVPEIDDLWNYEKNGAQTPDSVKHRSGYNAHFKCNQGHSFQSPIDRMFASDGKFKGCLICNSRRLKAYAGEDDIMSQIYNMSDFWRDELNPDINPHELKTNSYKNIVLMCPKSHIFETQPQKITKKVICPTCDLIENKSLAARFKDTMRFWDYEKNTLDPTRTYPYSKEIANWKCPDCGYEWTQSICDRVTTRNICVRCGLKRKDIRYEDSFEYAHPEIAKMFVDKLNDGILPSNVAKNSTASVYLRCEKCKHVYQKQVYAIPLTEPYGCPYCQHRTVVKGKTDLFTLYPHLRSMWDDESNEGYELDEINPYSDQSVYWICDKNHRFKRQINKFVQDQSCPICKKEKNAIVNFPHLVNQWDFEKNHHIDIYTTSASSNEEVNWKCQKCGYEWRAKIRSRRYVDGNCPCCENRTVVMSGVTDVFTLIPELADYYDEEENQGLDKNSLSITSQEKIAWHCKKCGLKRKVAVSNLIGVLEDGSYYVKPCSGCNGNIRTVSYGEQYPTLADMFHNELNKENIYDVNDINRTDKYWWHCDTCGNDFNMNIGTMIRSLTSQYKGCPFCAGKRVDYTNSFAYLHPELMDEYSPKNIIDAYDVTEHSSKEVEWICKRNPTHIWKGTFYERSIGHKACPYCHTYNYDMMFYQQYPEMEKYYDADKNGERPFTSFSLSSNEVVNWKCVHGHSFSRSFLQMHRIGEFQCPVCEGTLVIPGVNDLATYFPDLAKEYDVERNGNHPSTVSVKNSNRDTYWKCENGHSFQMAVGYRVEFQSECPICSGRIIKPGINDLKTMQPKAAEVWDENKNDKDLEYVSPNSIDLYWWKCEKGHSYQARIESMERNNYRCLVCDNLRMQDGVNTLADTHPDLCKEISHKEKRRNNTFMKDNAFSILWECPTCHGEYYASPRDREVGDDSCPYCNRNKPLLGYNTLVDTHPDLAKEWSENNVKLPTNVTKESASTVLWICPICHGEYSAAPQNREVGDDSCPYCNRNKPLLGYNTLIDTHPDLAKEWSENNVKLPTNVTKESVGTVLWICPTCHGEYSATPQDREVGDDSCPYCNRNKPLLGYNTLVDTHPDLAKEWSENNVKSPTNVTKESVGTVLWICPTCHGEYSATPHDREVGDDSCPYCNKNKPLLGYNTLVDTHPDLAKEWSKNNVKSPTNVTKESASTVLWICPICHGEYSAAPQNREVGDDSCPYCNKNKPLLGYNTLVDTHPDLAKEWSGNNVKLPTNVTKESVGTVLWICPTCHGEYSAAPQNREVGDDSCPYCNKNKPLLGYNTLVDTHPDLAKEWSGNNAELPCEYTKQHAKRVLWRCPKCNGEYAYSIRQREMGDDSCPYCNNKLPLKDYNTLNVTNPDELAEWDYASNYLSIQPNEILARSNKKVWWKCSKCGYSYKMSPRIKLYYKMRHQKACPYCKGRRRRHIHYFM